jgi:putative DNA primase/helicase
MLLDLKSGATRPSDPLDYCTKIGAVCAAPSGTPHPLWDTFLTKVTAGNTEVIGFLQRFLGYCLTGHVDEQVLMFIYGTGANGKSVFVSTVAGIMGDYALVAPMDMFFVSRTDRHPTEIARLKGVRLVTAQEIHKGRYWDEAKIKNLTGGDRLTGRFMRGDFFDFTPTHKLMIHANHTPMLHVVDEAIRRRFLLVPFTVQIPEAERDRDLAKKLEAEWPAILRWMIDGCLEWQRGGLQVPQVVRTATEEYLTDQDAMGEWLEGYIISEHDVFTLTAKLFGSWKDWCGKRRLEAGTETAFADSLKDRGYAKDRRKYGRGFKGIKLRTKADPD